MVTKETTVKIHKGVKLVRLTGLLVFVLEWLAGYYYNVCVEYYHSDGISRVANAFYVLYSRNPHLGAIGFVWNPLPSVIDMFFLLLYPWIPAMATKGIAGLLMCALSASLTAGMAAKAFLQRGLPGWSAVIFPLLFCLNPMIFIFGFNGMSDAPFMYFLIGCIFHFLNWMDTGKINGIILASGALAMAFWCRYEAVPFGFAVIVSAGLVVFLNRQESSPAGKGNFRQRWSKAEGILLVTATPLVYSILLWMLLNAVIMKNPFYFLNGEYSNVSQIQGHLNDAVFASMVNHPVNAFLYALKKSAVFSAPLVSVLLLKIWNKRLLRLDTLLLLGMFLSIPMLQVLLLVKGSTLAWLRYFIYVFPVVFAWLPYELSKLRHKWQIGIPLLAMLINVGILSYVITQPSIAPDENTYLQNSFGRHNQTYYDQRRFTEIAAYVDQHHPQSDILVDSFSAYMIILESRYPKRFFISSDFEFKNAVSDPRKFGVEYVLIPKPGSATVISAINNAYPNLFDQGAAWAELEKDFAGRWRLYRITKSTGKADR